LNIFNNYTEAEQISSVANECKNVISFSIIFAGGGEMREWKNKTQMCYDNIHAISVTPVCMNNHSD
jgi:hypothetical protein